MSDSALNDWESAPFKDGLVSIGTHKLYLRVKGPPRTNNKTPVLIAESGLGGSSAWWGAVERLSSHTVRFYSYDRAGLGRSEASSQPRNAENMAAELLELLHAVNVSPPYILLSHSYGGIISREFLAAVQSSSHPVNDNPVVGMILLETNQERTHAIYAIPWMSVGACIDGIDSFEVTGLSRENRWTPEEAALIKHEDDSPTVGEASGQERVNMLPSSETLALKNQFNRQVLGSNPVVVIRGETIREFDRLFEAGITKGNGTAEQRKDVMDWRERVFQWDEKLQREQLQLSANSRFVQALNSGHTIHATEPELVAEEVLRLFAECQSSLATA